MKREPKRVDLMFFQRHGLGGRVQLEPAEGLAEVLRRPPGADAEITLTLVGRKGRDFIPRRGAKILAEHINILGRPTYQDAAGIAQRSHPALQRRRDGRGLHPQQRLQERDVADSPCCSCCRSNWKSKDEKSRAGLHLRAAAARDAGKPDAPLMWKSRCSAPCSKRSRLIRPRA